MTDPRPEAVEHNEVYLGDSSCATLKQSFTVRWAAGNVLSLTSHKRSGPAALKAPADRPVDAMPTNRWPAHSPAPHCRPPR